MINLAQRLRMPPILVAPGVYDPLSALIAAQAGAQAVFVSGAMVAMSQYALPDFGLGTASELTELVARIADRVDVPVIVDGDQGFGNAAHIQRLVRGLCRAGAAAVQIEDQQPVKDASALRARPLITIAEMVGKIRAAQDARTREDFLISARTDALSSTGVDDALARAAAYAGAGADMVFVEGISSHAQVAALFAELGQVAQHGTDVPLVHNLLEGSGTPFADAAQAGAAGFALALFPATALGLAVEALRTAYRALVADGSSAALSNGRVGLDGLNDVVGTADMAARIAGYGGGS